MKKNNQNRITLAAVLTAVCLLLAGILSPAQPRGAWWCTAFSIVCGEAVNETDTEPATAETVTFRWRLADWWQTRGE